MEILAYTAAVAGGVIIGMVIAVAIIKKAAASAGPMF
jgi:uncharacterized protein YneF (UPF0154 family)